MPWIVEPGFFPLEEGSTVVYLGACQGRFVEYYSERVGDSGQLFCLEPVIENYHPLVQQIVEKQFMNVIPILGAIGRKTQGEVIHLAMKHDRLQPIAHSFVFTEGRGGQGLGGDRVVPVFDWGLLMDALNLKHVNLAKVNIEGSEIAFLEGMTKVFPDNMIIEEHHSHGTDLEKLFELLKNRGYKILKHKKSILYVQKKEALA